MYRLDISITSGEGAIEEHSIRMNVSSNAGEDTTVEWGLRILCYASSTFTGPNQKIRLRLTYSTIKSRSSHSNITKVATTDLLR